MPLFQYGNFDHINRQGSTTGDGSWQTGGTNNTATIGKKVVMQTGTLAVNNVAGTDTTITFPVAFTQAPVVFAMQNIIASANVSVNANTVTTSNFVLRILNTSGAGDTFAWCAVGQIAP